MSTSHLFRTLGVAVCAMALGMPLSAASRAASAQSRATDASQAPRNAWPAETISGRIVSVDPSEQLVVLQSGGVPFDMRVTKATRIEVGNQKPGLDQLTPDTGKKASVTFIPERSGDIARTIRING